MKNKPEEKLEMMPVNNVQWIHCDNLIANDYNPNNVFSPEMRLLKLSILQDGWTLPIVVKRSENDGIFEIIDGFHRWTICKTDKKIADLTDGYIPCVIIVVDGARQKASTIRYNRARGVHHVVKMADIVNAVKAEGMSEEDIMQQFGMDATEIEKLSDYGNMLKHGSSEEFNNARVPMERKSK